MRRSSPRPYAATARPRPASNPRCAAAPRTPASQASARRREADALRGGLCQQLPSGAALCWLCAAPGTEHSVPHKRQVAYGGGCFQPPPFPQAVIIGIGKPIGEIGPLRHRIAPRPGTARGSETMTIVSKASAIGSARLNHDRDGHLMPILYLHKSRILTRPSPLRERGAPAT